MTRDPISRRGLFLPQLVETEFLSDRTTVPDGDRVVLIASYSPDNRVTRSLSEFIGQLVAAGYPAVLIRATDDPRPLAWPGPVHDIVAIRKPNLGYDFGSWSVGMHIFPQVTSRRFVLLVNDSLVGPFASIEPLIKGFESAKSNVWGVTGTTQFIPHLQSYFLGFAEGILADPAIASFWARLPIESSKLAMVDRYEMGLARLLFGEALSTTAYFEPELVVAYGQNPTVNGWQRLIELGFPFVKRSIVSDRDLVFDGDLVAPTVRATFGVDIEDWL